ncbi:MAG: hypothetical protein KIT33_08775 [Candidatus Kapabacteria bacterium]|nr:hypothetical protein [Ignavibacteriota bacterium]MCW5885049.1 hypothetical protein [Candidatus Kapabacteria bacterium]
MNIKNTNSDNSGGSNKFISFAGNKFIPVIALIIIAVSIIAVYSNIHGNSIHFDDEFIFKNTDLHDPSDFDKLFSINKFRLVPFWTFAVNYTSSNGGKELAGFYNTNIAIHIINSFFAIGILFLIFKTPVIKETEMAKYGPLIAFSGALLFAMHPLQTQAVTYIYQRLASIATTFYFGAVLTYLAGRISKKGLSVKLPLFGLSFIFLILGLFSKENVFTIFPMILILELILFNKNFRLSPAVIGVFLGLIALGIFIFLQFQVPSNIFQPINNFNGETVTSQNYLITQFKVLPLYLRLFIAPYGQNFDHDIRISESFFDSQVLLGFGILVILLAFAIYMYKYNRLITFGILWFFLTISVESSIIPIADVVFEHRVYLPMIGLVLALTAILYELISKKEKLIPVLFIFLFIFSAFSAFLAHNRNKVWESEISLWSDVISKSPKKARAYFKRGQALISNKKVNQALDDFNKTIEYNPEFISAYTYRAAIHINSERFKEAITDYDKFIELSKDKTQGYLNRARVFSRIKRNTKALEDYNSYLKRNNLDIEVYLEKAAVYESMNDAVSAINTTKEALKIDSTNTNAIVTLGKYLYMRGEFDNALPWIDKVINSEKATRNSKLIAYNIKGSIYFFKKDYDEALKFYDEAEKINKKHKPLLINYALIYRTLGDYEKELAIIDRILEFDRRDDNNWLARGICNINLKRYNDADKDLRRALEINRKNKEANYRHASIYKYLQ